MEISIYLLGFIVPIVKPTRSTLTYRTHNFFILNEEQRPDSLLCIYFAIQIF